MRRARVVHDGHSFDVREGESGELLTVDGTVLDPSDVTWLPPVAEPGTIFAVGLNYADHASELAFKPPEKPLVFLKHANCLTGHETGLLSARRRRAPAL